MGLETALMAIAGGAQAAGPVVGGFSARQRGRAEARTQRKLGRAAESERLKEGQRLLGQQRVAFAKGGVDPNTGSALDVGASTAGDERLASRRLKEAYAAQGRDTKRAGNAGLLQGILMGLGNAASMGGKLGARALGGA